MRYFRIRPGTSVERWGSLPRVSRLVLSTLLVGISTLTSAYMLIGTINPLELLVGPLTPVGTPVTALVVDYDTLLVVDYDTLQLTQGYIYAEGFPADLADIANSNFYDLALTLYTIYYRTNDTYWRDKARTVARAWRDDPYNRNIAAYLQGHYHLAVWPPRYQSTLGLAIYASEANDALARQVVNDQARLDAHLFSTYGDTRESAYALMAMVAAWLVNGQQPDAHLANAKVLLDSILAAQQANGQWTTTSDSVSAGPFTLNYMTGLLMEALALYDRAIGDPRILPALQRAIDWTWSTQWVPSAQAFQYANLNSGSVDTTPYANLNGLLLPAWGYVYAHTGEARYLDQATQILQGLVTIGGTQISEVKQFGQLFRSSSRYLGYLTALISLP